ncbi:hypothetical protein Acor_78990 [Acrocarpospora corrugata]|uniref:EfeO-type cupredoxin-like domain-containing protein n=1 Tax=Acrocarpospora corrugata TaxID=35763 RepID=A0A5M3WC57_9ACTN|nr:hypothetical protein [Acrocarpospora corrugata]GES05830.1 hypothetical protein Acor_78990 [Acrocarpospora corrugata]
MKSLIALLVGVVLSVTACGASDAATFSGPAKEIAVTIAGGAVTPPPGRIEVAKGQQVKISVTSDVADEAHVHGYDKSAALQPGAAASIEFVADQDGLFEVETHESGLQLFQLVVQ